MNEAIRTRNHWKTAAIMLLAVLVLLVVALASMLQPAATTDAGSPAVHPGVHAPSAVGPGSADDPYMDRHAEVVSSYRGVVPDAASTTKDPYTDRHADVVAGYQQGGPR